MSGGWQTKAIGDVCKIRPPKSEARDALRSGDLVSFVPMEDLPIGSKTLSIKQQRPLSEVVNAYTYFADGDVLLAKITPCFENGKLGMASNLMNGVGFGSSEYIVLRPEPTVTSEWLYYYLARESFRIEGASKMSGAVGHKRVPQEFIERYPIPVPPLTEQKRIIAILDRAFEAIDTAKDNFAKNSDNSKALFESCLDGIFSKGGDGWIVTTLDRISENCDSKRVPITKAERKKGAYPYYGASGIVDYVANYLFDGDHLLISEDGANLLARSSPIAFSASGKYWVNNHAHILRFDSMATQRFVEYYVNSIKIDQYVTGAAQPKLTQLSLNKIPIPIPKDVREQASIVNRFTEIQADIDRLAGIYVSKRSACERLRESLLYDAFFGKLAA